jgi:tRNA(Arg) A34 adenosine deaminase TadA
MTIEELLYRLALIYGDPTGKAAKRAALLVKIGAKSEGWQVVGKAIDAPGAGIPPVAKILTTLAKELGADEFLGDRCLALNYAPTDWCLGLAWLLKVRYVIYRDDGMKAVRTSTNTVGNKGFPSWDQSNWELACTYNTHREKFVFNGDLMDRRRDYQKKEQTAIQAAIASVNAARVFAAASVQGVQFSKPPAPAFSFICMPGSAVRDDLFTRAAFALVNKTWKHADRTRPQGLSGHNIGALAVGPDDQILGWAVNVSEVSRCFHAESLLIFQLLNRGIKLKEIKLRIYCTLEPCHMCAGVITTYCAGAQVFYGMADSNIENSCLARKKSKCEQLLSKTIVNRDETIPALCAKLRQQFGDEKPITGFLDAPNAARPAFQKPAEQLAVVPNAIRSLGTQLAELNRSTDLEHRRRMQALLDIRPAKPTVLH